MTTPNERMEELMIADELEFQHVLECVFDVQEHESRTYLALLDAPGSTVAELAEDLERDRSNVNRSLGTLVEKGLAERERRLLDAGGYVYQYTAVPLPEARERMHEAVEEWSAQVHERIDEFGSAR